MNKQQYRELKTLYPSIKTYVIKYFIFNLASMVVGAITPLFYAIFVDEILGKNQKDLFIYVAMGYLATCIVGAALSLGFSYIQNMFNKRFRLCLSKEILCNISNCNNVSQLDFMDLKSRYTDDINYLIDYIHTQKCNKYFQFVLGIFYFALLFYIQPLFTIISLIFIPITFFITSWRSKRFSIIYEEDYNKRNKMERFAYKTYEFWKEIKILNLEEKQINIYSDQLQDYGFFKRKLMMYNFFNAFIERFQGTFLIDINIYLIGCLFILNGSITLGVLLMFVQYYNSFYSSVLSIQNIKVSYRKSLPGLERILYLLFEIKKVPVRTVSINDSFKKLELRNICFTYSDSLFSLKNINLSFYSGERVAVIGETGSGKTTLLQAILGMLIPQSGRIYMNNKDITGANILDFNRFFSVVSQEPVFFNMTIKDNFLLVKPDATDEAIEMCCIKANILNRIMELPDKYDTIMGENANFFSVGERQRLALARAFLNDADIFIFDEITSALDPKNEEMIYRCIDEMPNNKSIIMITHRIDKIPNNFSILKVNNGEIVNVHEAKI